jgi:hypothetical protein
MTENEATAPVLGLEPYRAMRRQDSLVWQAWRAARRDTEDAARRAIEGVTAITGETPFIFDYQIHLSQTAFDKLVALAVSWGVDVETAAGMPLTAFGFALVVDDLTDEDWQVWHGIHSRRLGLTLIGDSWYSESFLRRCFCTECAGLLEELSVTRAAEQIPEDVAQ